MLNSHLNRLMNNHGLQKVNSATKYPSILTYHNLGERGTLVDSLVEDKSFVDIDEVFITEKVDGTNSRIVFTTNDKGYIEDYFIGSREDILFACEDRIINPILGIVNTIKPIADTLKENSTNDNRKETFIPNSIYAFYGETFGGNINGFKQYTSHKTFGYRMFDMWHMSIKEFESFISIHEPAEIASWREHGGQPFVSVNEIQEFTVAELFTTVPYVSIINGTEIPTTLKETYEWLLDFEESRVILDKDYMGKGRSEGVVVRNASRSLIRKIRFEDYEKTMRSKAKK